ncbi:MAG: glycerol-3-phosphate dehydrogenase/oxidase [Bdellovibrionales bacterium]|nr:glycerol-3-phosphate dehydrogenase/oxidase [Bdellovibrionales bacterium]
MADFSFRTRETNLKRFREETFDLLVIGGGITGAAVARDAASRGLRVALVEKSDFAQGTSSRSTKLIHGGLRYLENFEFKLVFEALSERSHLMKTMPHLVRPLPFYFPVFEGDRNSKTKVGLGMWFYDLLALFRTPGFHKNLSREGFLKDVPFLKADGLVGGYRYFDASMWDDVMVVEVLRSAQVLGAAIANYTEAIAPIWKGDQVVGYRVRDRELRMGQAKQKPEFDLKAKRTVICGGPWTDQLGLKMDPNWRAWIKPSKGVHLVFDWKKIPIPGALVMSHPSDGRISFVIPRPDLGAGVVIVGTTDGPTPTNPEDAKVDEGDIEYLLKLVQSYFPSLAITRDDILSTYVGVRPLMDPDYGKKAGAGGKSLQKVSREHHIEKIPGGIVVVAGGKYTTHRTMAQEIVDEVLSSWRQDARAGKCDPLPRIESPHTRSPVNPKAISRERTASEVWAKEKAIQIPEAIWDRYGAEAIDLHEIAHRNISKSAEAKDGRDPDGFPWLDAQLRFAVRNGMVMHLDDFFRRRTPLYLSRKDHGYPWAKRLVRVFMDEMEPGTVDAEAELARLNLHS